MTCSVGVGGSAREVFCHSGLRCWSGVSGSGRFVGGRILKCMVVPLVSMRVVLMEWIEVIGYGRLAFPVSE